MLRTVLRRSALPSLARGATAARWASEWLQGRPPAVDPRAGTLAAFYYGHIREAAIPTRDHVVAPGQDERFNVSQFDTHVYAYAVGMLEGLGLKRGHRVGIWMTNELESLVIQYAAGLLGIAVVAIDPAVGFQGVLRIVGDEQLRTLIVSPRFGGVDRVPQLVDVFEQEILPVTATPGYENFDSKRFRALKQIVCTSREHTDGITRLRDLPVFGTAGVYDMDEIAAVQVYVTPGDVLTQYYGAGAGAAAGSADAVKGLSVTHAQALAAARRAAEAMNLTSTDVVLSTAHLHTSAGLAAGALAPASVGAKLVLPGKDFDAAATLAAATAQRATAIVTTPAHAIALAAALAADAAAAGSDSSKAREYDLSALRTGLVLGGGGSGSVLGSSRLIPWGE